MRNFAYMKRSIDIDGVSVSYLVEGDGPLPVIVMHGWGCKADTVALLAGAASDASTTVYNLDLPGFGDSTEPPEVWGIEDYTRFLEHFTTALGIKRPVLIGHSFGGRMAINFASRNDTTKVILVDAAGIKPRRSLARRASTSWYKFCTRLAPVILGRKLGERLIDKWRRKRASADYLAASPRMRAILSKVVNEDLTGRLPLIKAPTLLIWGEKDTATPIADARTMERMIPDAGLVSYPEAGHYSFLDRPAQTRAVIESFLKIKR